ncbi:ArsO family NAD(P)H-dependent flavin-containing monooxygenase [Arthrobacter halodurans]|uniref:ArsO family NAD(P)H-dependent flavin-containing monooxygenase n=1 Tax=Arthrobacter halodurans TaxID=516699 RepID=A0ABV4UJL4_9MICC
MAQVQPQPRDRDADARDVDVLVIGGGQAGLAAGYYLHRLARDAASGRGGPAPSYAILDAGARPGGAWRDYWKSLELFSPAAFSSLPGYQMPAWEGGGNPSAGHVVEYLQAYEARYGLPVHRPTRVLAVRDGAGGGFSTEVATGTDTWTSRVVINATGTWTRPVLPTVPGSGDFAGEQLHTADYRGPVAFAGQRVVVVGGGNSGAQVAADLLPVAEVTWVTRKPPRYLPDDVDGRALFQIASRHVRALARGEESPGGVGSLGDIVAVPPVRRARDAGLLTPLPMFSRATPTGVAWDDGRSQEVDAIIWCTGFGPQLDHLASLGLDADAGVPTTDPALPTLSADRPGLFFLGYGDWCGPASATLIGVGPFARDTVAAASRYALAPSPAPG